MKLMVLDGNSLAYSLFALPTDMVTSSGQVDQFCFWVHLDVAIGDEGTKSPIR